MRYRKKQQYGKNQIGVIEGNKLSYVSRHFFVCKKRLPRKK